MSSSQPIHALNLDSNQQKAFIKYFSSLPEKPPTTVRIFDRNDYYSVHGLDATTAAREVFHSVANIKRMADESKLEYLVLSKTNFEILIKRLLLVRRYRVEIYVAEGSLKNNEWNLKYKGSPGYFSQLEDILGEAISASQDQTPCLMAVNIKTDPVTKGRLLGVACVTACDYQMSVAEFTDDEILTELETITVQLAPCECLIPQVDNDDYKALIKVMERASITLTKLKRSDFSVEGLQQDLSRLLKFRNGQQPDANSFPEIGKIVAMPALAAAIKYTALITENSNFEKFRLSTIKPDCYLHVDATAVAALNVFPELGDTSRSPSRSLLGLLDKCRTQQGKRLLAQWLRQPLRDINLINERLDVVECLMNNSQLRQQLHQEHLRRIPDLQALVRKLTRRKANLQDCYKIYLALNTLPSLLNCLSEAAHPTVQSSLAEPIAELNEDLEKYKEMIEATVDMDAAGNGEYLVKPSFDDNLHELSQQLSRMQRAAERELNNAAKELGLEAGKTIKLENNPQHGFCFRVVLKLEKSLRGKDNFIIIDAVKGGVRFKTAALDEATEDYVETRAQYEKDQDNVVAEIVSIAAGYSECLFCVSHILSRLDVLVAFSVASVAAPEPYCRPVVTESCDELILRDVRHPCLEIQDGVSYIPNDVEFKRGSCLMHIVTGANMGGKSTWMRSCGIAVLLAHAGCPVPASRAVVPRLRGLFARVGAADREERGQSTFMLEMVESAAILRTATHDSLVLVDELGRGTSTYEGCGMAWSIAETLATDLKCFSLFATHFHELTRLASVHPGAIVNSHAEASVVNDQVLLLHKIAPGPAMQSLGLHIARLAGIQESVMQKAEALHEELDVSWVEDETTAQAPVVAEGQRMIAEFMQQCKRIQQSTTSDEALMTQINELKEQLVRQNNKYVLSLMGLAA